MVPNDPDLLVDCEYPHVPSFTEDIAGAPYFTPQPPKQFGMDFDFAPVENDDFLIVNHPVIDVGRLLDTEMNLDNGYMLQSSYQPVDAPLAGPSSVGSTPECSP